MAKREKLFSKIVIIVFLVMVVLGFVIPSVLNNSSSDSARVEPRICNTDSDCYLFCDDQPVTVLCMQNLCAVNSCEEQAYFEYSPSPVSFTLQIQNVTLEERSDDKNVFVKFSGNAVQSFNPKLSLYYILEKAKIILDTQCLTFDQKQYCSSDLSMTVDGNSSTAFGNYIPKEGDVIEIKY